MSNDLKKMLLGNKKLIIPSDEMVHFTIGRNPHGNIVLDFGKDLKCLVLTPEGALQLAALIEREARKS